MIISFECDVSDKLKSGIENYMHPKNVLLQLTDDFFVENKAYYYGRMVLIVETSFFDLIARYMAYFGVIGLLFSWLVGNLQLWSGVFFISLLLVAVSSVYLSSKIRFYLLRWRVHKVIDASLRMDWLSKEQVVSRFIHGEMADESE